jgi:ketosteroid isomerase-like protein
MIDAVAVLKRYHGALNAFDLGEVENMFAADAVYVSPGLKGVLTGRANIMAALRKYFAEYDDQISTDERIEKIDHLKVRSIWHLKATSKITKAKVIRRGEEIITLNNKGLIIKIDVVDQLSVPNINFGTCLG